MVLTQELLSFPKVALVTPSVTELPTVWSAKTSPVTWSSIRSRLPGIARAITGQPSAIAYKINETKNRLEDRASPSLREGVGVVPDKATH